MFSYLKYFFVISLILIIGASTFFTWVYRDSVHDILQTQNKYSNMAVITGYKNAVWKKYEEIIPLLAEIAEDERKDFIEYQDLLKDSKNYFSSMPVVAFSIYSAKSEALISHPEKTDNSAEPQQALLDKRKIGVGQAVQAQTSLDEMIEDVDFISAEGQNKHGTLLHSITPIFNANKELVGVVEIFMEMTDSTSALDSLQYIGGIFIIGLFLVLLSMLYYVVRRAEKIIAKQYEVNVELETAKVAAESENEQKSQFLANISHELRTPLNAIIGFSEIMKDEILGAIGNEQYKNYILDIHNQGVHLLSLINDILDFSKAEAGKLDLEYEDVDLNKLIKQSLRTQEPRAKNGEVELLDELPNDHIIMRTDVKRLKQIMLNLLSNAVKFTPPNGKVKVSAWESATDGKIGFEVADTGIGIAPKDISKALAPFGQVDSELSRRYEGTGLGLPLTKKFIELLGGTMTLDSEVGKGTKITVMLPKNQELELFTASGGKKGNLNNDDIEMLLDGGTTKNGDDSY